ncbi:MULTISPECIES: alcohol dehydrogenase catalytic domain-containing protein [Mycetohabitans]|uniref:alcohol dehydrogenase catalytic domain-containing protein n=1 Tax=Mycetohabitans TaxID=2571159 RepID=UPI00257091B9|nr:MULTISPECIES: alcohol dehydrogenase catalytic domain-containing protein [Burkholderiaceae]
MRDQHYPVPLPAVLGHEGAGIVEQVGPTVKDLKAGDHVVLTYGACGHCNPCASGHKAYCKDFYPLNFGGSDAHGHTARCRHLRANRYTIISLPSPLFCHLRARARAQRHQGAH